MAGKAAIIVDGSASDASLVMTHQVPLSDEIVAEMRLGEVICVDGSGGLVPDIVVPPTQTVGGEDHALTTALALLNDFKPSTMVGVPLPAYVVPRSEKPYREMVFPALEYRLLAAFRIWGVINYFFPYKHLIEEDWDGVLREFIPRMEQAASALEYHRTVAEMVTHIHDSHGNIESPVLKEHVGTAGPPVRLQMIENTPVVTTLLDNEVPQTAGVTRGDSILAIDGEDIRDRMNRLEKYRAHSTPHRQKYWAAFASLLGPADSLVRLTVRDKHNQVKEVTLRRKLEYGTGNINQRNRDVIAFLSEDIGYADLDRLNVSQVDEMFETLKNTQAIIFDMRGYPNGTAWEIAPRLSERHDVEAALYHCPVVMTPDGRNGELARQSVSYSFVQVLPRTEKWRYQGKTVMLIDERTQSQAEHTGLFLKAANGTTFVGSPTAGANGDVTNFQVPA
jgi:C-terminal processing protease CtpA/Prc